MYKIVFFDIDGTLIDESYGIPNTAKIAIDMCKKKGIYVCLCTGRPIGTIPDDVMDLKFNGTIAGGGSYIKFNNKTIFENYFDIYKMKSACYYLKNEIDKTAFTFETNDIVFMNKEAVEILNGFNESKFKKLTKEQQQSIQEKEKISYENNIDKFNENIDKVNKICLWSSEKVFINLLEIFKEEGFQLAQSFSFKNIHYYEIIQNGCNKGEAIVKLCDYLKISLKETLAFGDGKNDIDMFKTVETSVGVKSGDVEIFKFVDSICEEPINDGIYLELEKRNVI